MSKPNTSRQESALGNVLQVAVAVFLVLVSIPFALVYLVVANRILEPWRRRRFRRRYAGRVVLVWTSRRGWHDFVVNNVLPVLPQGAMTIYQRKARPAVPSEDGFPIRYVCEKPLSRPYLVSIAPRGCFAILLNPELGQLKGHAARDPEVQRQVARILERAVQAASAGQKRYYGGSSAST